MKRHSHLHRAAFGGVLLLLLAACGGGGGADAVPMANVGGTDVPTSATEDPAAATAFVRQVAASSSQTGEPILVGDVKLATSETAEPDPGV